MASLAAGVSASRAGSRPGHLSRRAVLHHAGALGFIMAGHSTATSAAASAAPSVAVAAPHVVRNPGCLATVSVLVTLTGLMPGAHYVLSGAVFEADGWVENADFCCSLDPQTVVITDLGHHYRRLNRQAIAADLGLLKGMGPARDEEVSAKGVELFARIWLRDLTSRKQAGPWDSPLRVVASRSQAGWTSSPQQDDNPLMLPHGGRSATNHESVGLPMPPEACWSDPESNPATDEWPRP